MRERGKGGRRDCSPEEKKEEERGRGETEIKAGKRIREDLSKRGFPAPP